MSDLYKNVCLCCDFCQAKFKDTSRLNRHIKTSKKCLSKRTEIKFSCIWCNEEFISNIYLEKHSSKCQVNKDTAYLLLLEKCKEKDRQLEEKDRQLEEKDRQLEEKDKQIEKIENEKDKLYALANTSKTTTVNNGIT
jgi:DNA repair exonuclease SbcCD ATPase subunit